MVIYLINQMSDPFHTIIECASRAEKQLIESTAALNAEVAQLEQEQLRAEALSQLFEEKRFVDDIKNGRICQPPIFYEEWNNNIGKIIQYVEGADNYGFPQMYDSYSNTIQAHLNSHKNNLINALK